MDLAGWSIKLNLQIERGPAKKTKPVLQLTQFINNQLFIMADITLTIGQNIGFQIKLFDNVTNEELTATLANTSVSNTNPEFAGFSVSPFFTNIVNGNGISTGSGTITITADVTYTDPGNGQTVTENLSVTKSFEVIGSPHGAHIDIVIS